MSNMAGDRDRTSAAEGNRHARPNPLFAVLGQRVTLREARKQTLSLPDGTPVIATFHPSALLRAPDIATRETYARAARGSASGGRFGRRLDRDANAPV